MSVVETLNDKQKEAALYIEGPLLILAGAGSGKTRVITNRTAYMIKEKGINPFNILAITFTNKAAGEMRERINDIVGYGAESIWVATFHSTCARILRRYIDRIGYDTSYTIYDTDDVKSVINDIIKRFEINTKYTSARALINCISSCKNEMITANQFARDNAGDFGMKDYVRVYKEYEEVLKKSNALDFDDLLLKTVELFTRCPDVLESYQERFKYIMVDEYQDTNTVQFELVRLLADKYKNICVVGDDDQSIYKFRGANIRNILDFEKHYPDAKVVRLEQNYRSTQIILDVANAVIKNNSGRKEKSLWTKKENGERVHLRQFETAYEEAEYIASEISKNVANGSVNYRDNAVLYRTNAQSRLLEEKFILFGIPYDVVGGINFYSRREIKDILAYLKTIDNGKDDLAVKRIINVPRRGIGATSLNRVQQFGNKVLLMTLHAAKGLEFPRVYMAGMEDGLFPSYMTIVGDDEDELEEERRLCYVGITRAMDELTLTYAKSRMVRGEMQFNAPSRFIREMPALMLDNKLPGRRNQEENFSGYGSAKGAGNHKAKVDIKPFILQADAMTKGKDLVKSDGLEYNVGDRVSHIKFGVGEVISIVDGGRDFEVAVDFEKYGIKKMFAAFAKLKKV